MSEVKIKFPDGSEKAFARGVTGLEIAKSISPRLAKEALAVRVNGHMRDLSCKIEEDAPIEVLTFDSPEGKFVFWHSSAHIMAQAVTELFPKVKLAIGPPIEEGFYYDFEVEKPFSPEDLEKIEKRVQEIIKENAEFERVETDRKAMLDKYRKEHETYKVEMLEEDILDDRVTVYKHSSFEDLCRGPHIPNTGIVKAFKLLASSGAYWRGDEKKTMLQRIYGVSYPKKSMLDDFLYRQEEAKKRDHRMLGKQLELFHITNEVGAGLVMWLPKGAIIRNEIENFWREEHLKNGYELVFTPHIANLDLWHRSGHTDHYVENMYQPVLVDEEKYQLKPMNCPFHIMMYKSRRWSYRDLPLRWAELGTVYRYEMPGVLHGLMRVRGFTQDDAHHFVSPEGMEDELVWLIKFCLHILDPFKFQEYDIYLSTRPENAIGDPEDWVKAENGLRRALDILGLKYAVDQGGGAFYGPKIDIKIKDALGRSWQCSTIQFDFSLPDRFEMSYADKDGKLKRPFMIHRALLGSIERFFGVLIEHYAGKFPLWLAPVQAKILPITDDFNDYGREIQEILKKSGFRAELDSRSEKIGHKIRESELQKIPYMLIIGAKEKESGSVSVRLHGIGDKGTFKLEALIELMKAERDEKALQSKLL
ncbi:MAG: threonine--tRNA ligase [candidate division Zixibacteria bacterium HGW-Zixibacteria-1]|nr:MAG: threonine--tRNA ligase [candidate division Zixibacteria bacterium HGW-Zixibacteria-1]